MQKIHPIYLLVSDRYDKWMLEREVDILLQTCQKRELGFARTYSSSGSCNTKQGELLLKTQRACLIPKVELV